MKFTTHAKNFITKRFYLGMPHPINNDDIIKARVDFRNNTRDCCPFLGKLLLGFDLGLVHVGKTFAHHWHGPRRRHEFNYHKLKR